jgi:tripeptide aminopeptidase
MHRPSPLPTVGRALTADRIAAVRSAAAAIAPDVVALTEQIARVPAPTGEEGERSRFVGELFRQRGHQTEVDALGDVVVPIAGRNGAAGAPVILAAHLDTVFPAATALRISRADSRLAGPGVGDNSLGVAALVCLPELLRAANEAPDRTVLLAADVGEEGLGNLRGMRAVLDARPDAAAVVAIEGHNLGRLTHVAVGSRRLKLTATGPGGHSWGDAGRPSAVHALAKVIAELSALPLSRSPKTSLNVGVFQGGVSVNTIAPEAWCVVDLRSVDAGALRRLGERVERVVAGANRGGVRVGAEVLGERPAGVVPLDSPIVRAATDVLGALGVEASYDASSTDANIPISRGVPAVCIGLTHGGNVHREDEYIELEPIATGLAQLALLTLALAED